MTTFFSNLPKMVHFWVNWKCSEGGFTISSTFLQQILRNLSRKISIEKKVHWHQSGRRWNRGIYFNFCEKNAFLRQKMRFFQKTHFIQKSSVTKNTLFKHVRHSTFLPKLWDSNFHQILPTYSNPKVTYSNLQWP